MITIAGIDPSLASAGIAIIRPGIEVRLCSVGARGHSTDNYEDRQDRIELQAYEIGKRVGHPDLIVMEGPAYGSSLPSAFDRAGLWWGVFSTLSRRAPIAVCPPQTRAKFATGKGTSKKQVVLPAVREMFPDVNVRNHDQADALICAAIGMHKLGFDLPFDILARHGLALQATAWPVNLPTGVSL